jgi:hypothetical protein
MSKRATHRLNTGKSWKNSPGNCGSQTWLHIGSPSRLQILMAPNHAVMIFEGAMLAMLEDGEQHLASRCIAMKIGYASAHHSGPAFCTGIPLKVQCCSLRGKALANAEAVCCSNSAHRVQAVRALPLGCSSQRPTSLPVAI